MAPASDIMPINKRYLIKKFNSFIKLKLRAAKIGLCWLFRNSDNGMEIPALKHKQGYLNRKRESR